MKITFPYMGPTNAYKKFIELLGHEVVVPPVPSQRTFDLGVKYSPEFVCFPFKVIMGNYIEAIEMGADTIITSGGNGPCRAGLYGEVHKEILHSLGYDVEVIVFDSMFRNFGEFWGNIKKIKGNNSLIKGIRDFFLCYRIVCSLDDFEKEIKIKRAYEEKKGELSKVWDQIKVLYDKVYNWDEFKEAGIQARRMIDAVPLRHAPDEERIRIGVVGEILVAMEPSVNMDIEKRLNEMGVEAENVHYISDWLRHNARPRIFGKSHARKLMDLGAEYIKEPLGGHEQENVGCMVDFKRRGFDGIVHLMPFGCLPELVTQSAIQHLSKELDIPILSLSIDEQTGKANNLTRIEAFVDLVKNIKKGRSSNMASGF